VHTRFPRTQERERDTADASSDWRSFLDKMAEDTSTLDPPFAANDDLAAGSTAPTSASASFSFSGTSASTTSAVTASPSSATGSPTRPRPGDGDAWIWEMLPDAEEQRVGSHVLSEATAEDRAHWRNDDDYYVQYGCLQGLGLLLRTCPGRNVSSTSQLWPCCPEPGGVVCPDR